MEDGHAHLRPRQEVANLHAHVRRPARSCCIRPSPSRKKSRPAPDADGLGRLESDAGPGGQPVVGEIARKLAVSSYECRPGRPGAVEAQPHAARDGPIDGTRRRTHSEPLEVSLCITWAWFPVAEGQRSGIPVGRRCVRDTRDHPSPKATGRAPTPILRKRGRWRMGQTG